jgi:hypothetical protein
MFFDSIIVLDIMPQLQTLSIYLATFLLRMSPPVFVSIEFDTENWIEIKKVKLKK